MKLHDIDIKLIRFFRQISGPAARIGLFVVFFWFGGLKLIGLSSAAPLVRVLFDQTISFMPFSTFIIILGLVEMIIGALFLFPGSERVVIPILFLHMFTTFLPLFMIPHETWSSFLVPTLGGQYIIKNLVIIALVIVIAANLNPLPPPNRIDTTS